MIEHTDCKDEVAVESVKKRFPWDNLVLGL